MGPVAVRRRWRGRRGGRGPNRKMKTTKSLLARFHARCGRFLTMGKVGVHGPPHQKSFPLRRFRAVEGMHAHFGPNSGRRVYGEGEDGKSAGAHNGSFGKPKPTDAATVVRWRSEPFTGALHWDGACVTPARTGAVLHPGPDVPGETPGPPSVGSLHPRSCGNSRARLFRVWLAPSPSVVVDRVRVRGPPAPDGGSLPARPRSCEGPVVCPPAHPPVPDRDSVRRGRRCSAWSMRPAHLRCDPRGRWERP